MYACSSSNHFASSFLYIHVHGAVARMVNAMVASSSPIKGSGTLQPGKASWSYIVRYDTRGRLVKYNHVDDEDNHEEEEDDDDSD